MTCPAWARPATGTARCCWSMQSAPLPAPPCSLTPGRLTSCTLAPRSASAPPQVCTPQHLCQSCVQGGSVLLTLQALVRGQHRLTVFTVLQLCRYHASCQTLGRRQPDLSDCCPHRQHRMSCMLPACTMLQSLVGPLQPRSAGPLTHLCTRRRYTHHDERACSAQAQKPTAAPHLLPVRHGAERALLALVGRALHPQHGAHHALVRTCLPCPPPLSCTLLLNQCAMFCWASSLLAVDASPCLTVLHRLHASHQTARPVRLGCAHAQPLHRLSGDTTCTQITHR